MSASFTERIFCLKTDIAFELQLLKHQENAYAKQFHDALMAKLKTQVETLNPLHINMWKNRIHVDK